MPSPCRLFLFLFAMAITCSRLQAQSSTQAADGAIFSFSQTVHDFGIVPVDTVVQCSFEFVNRGNARLIINDITLSCPCFTVDWTRGPVMPGEKGSVNVHYPTGAKPGPFDKALWITSNAVNNTANLDRFELRVKGMSQKQGDVSLSSHQKKMQRCGGNIPPTCVKEVRLKKCPGNNAAKRLFQPSISLY